MMTLWLCVLLHSSILWMLVVLETVMLKWCQKSRGCWIWQVTEGTRRPSSSKWLPHRNVASLTQGHTETNKHPRSWEVSLMWVSMDRERKLTLASHSNTAQIWIKLATFLLWSDSTNACPLVSLSIITYHELTITKLKLPPALDK